MPLFSVNNRHIPDCGDPPATDGDAPGFHSYFENAHGEQWLFVWSPGEAMPGFTQGISAGNPRCW